jgi:hypothetical protein
MVQARKKPVGKLMAEMNQAAVDAQNDLTNIDPEAVEKVAAWWKKWYLKAGHKRLGRILVKG